MSARVSRLQCSDPSCESRSWFRLTCPSTNKRNVSELVVHCLAYTRTRHGLESKRRASDSAGGLDDVTKWVPEGAGNGEVDGILMAQPVTNLFSTICPLPPRTDRFLTPFRVLLATTRHSSYPTDLYQVKTAAWQSRMMQSFASTSSPRTPSIDGDAGQGEGHGGPQGTTTKSSAEGVDIKRFVVSTISRA